MLSQFLLQLACDPEMLHQLKGRKRLQAALGKLTKSQRDAIASGDIHALRKLLYEERRRVKKAMGPLASDYTVSISGDTPHCPINMHGAFHPSFWEAREPKNFWGTGGLTIVGTGIRAGLQTTPESVACIKNAKKVLYLVADIISQDWIRSINPTAESMQASYQKGRYRLDIYNEIVSKIMSALQQYKDVCVVFYGDPGTFVFPAHEAIRRARKKGYSARMLPGISAFANFTVDLGVDPGVVGIQSYEATNFVLNRHRFDTSSGLVLWQVGLFGYAYWDPDYKPLESRIKILGDYLQRHYGEGHRVFLYEASEFPLGNAVAKRVPISRLHRTEISGVATLYVPPKSRPNADRRMVRLLEIPLPK